MEVLDDVKFEREHLLLSRKFAIMIESGCVYQVEVVVHFFFFWETQESNGL